MKKEEDKDNSKKESKEKEESKGLFSEYEESLTDKEKREELDFDVDFDKYDHSGRAMQDLDLYPIKDVIPKRNYPKSITDEEFFGEDDNSEKQKPKQRKYLER